MEHTQYRLENIIFIPSTNQFARITAIRKLFGVFVNDNILGTLSFNDIQPVPLTEELLLKNCNFNKDYKKGYIGIDVRNQDFVLTEPFKLGEWQKNYVWEFTSGGWSKYIEVEFLHNLQNLFKEIGRQELEIKI